jgi:hypothetical protein
MKIRTLKVMAANEEALMAERTARSVNVRKMIAAAAVAVSMIGTLAVTCAVAAVKADAKSHSMTPEVQLVDDYNTWYLGGTYGGDMEKLKAGLTKYITNETVLHEVASLPWGGTMVGYDGWVRLIQKSNPISEKISSLLEVSSPKYYQHGNVVIHEITLTIKPTKAAPVPFVMGIMEKYTVENGRIKQIDEFFADTASFLERLRVVGALPEHN